jgi:hypothetical protein
MANPTPRQLEFYFKGKWNNLPTKVIRLPEVFHRKTYELCKLLDNGIDPLARVESVPQTFPWTMEAVRDWMVHEDRELPELLPLEQILTKAIADARERKIDRRLERAVCFLADRCDGAREHDGCGFNTCDSQFGKWIAERVRSGKHLSGNMAKATLKMLQKYVRQLENIGLVLPEWEAIAHQYQATPEPSQEEKPPKRIEVIGHRLCVFHPFDGTGAFQQKAKTVRGYKFNELNNKGWCYPHSVLEDLIKVFPQSDFYYDDEIQTMIHLIEIKKAEAEAELHAEALGKATRIMGLVEKAKIDQPLSNGWILRDYQQKGVEWLLAHSEGGIYKGGILADDMGLGKTLESLVAAKALQRTHNCPVFVVCPVSLMEGWRRAATMVEVEVELFSNHFSQIPAPLESGGFVVIFDEAHSFQDPTSKRTKKFLNLCLAENCIAAWLLTGTPMKNGRPINLMPLLMAVEHPLVQNKHKFQERYCNGHRKVINSYGKTVWDVTGAAFLDELSQKTHDVILRRTKKECLPELPPKTRIFKQAELEKTRASEYHAEIKALVQNYKDRADAGEVDPSAEALVTLNILRGVGSRYKADSAITLAQELLEQGQQVVIFTEFIESAKAINAALGGELLIGGVDPLLRQDMVDRFQAGESKVFVGTIKSGGVGLTLTAASNVILVDRAWTPGDCEQAEDRCYRLGQLNAVFCHWLKFGTVDEAIDSLVGEKQERIEIVLKGKTHTIKASSPMELAKQLLRIL